MLKLAGRFLADETGATAIEYGLIVAVLSLAMIAGFTQFGNALESMLTHPEGELQQSLQRHQ
ncbi:Flp family type IVb pilin [Chelativorans sp. ZYF759]|uniref:Flp family type IVb pilin n=1 Tax=Chelativorans sp. ZYF759 TaxID=2692213 RepID=UPI00145CB6E7|nr:Flp family type IVb pilin [Chelativorans sp. ZYF759]NMG41161.1 Flp family type IVb pilin [Chelativorans sp. ZYF759]